MTPIPALHIRLEGLTASFRPPLTISGTQISTPVPSYSNLLGIISACAGRIVKPGETRIGFEFHCQSHDLEIERKDRLALKDGKLGPISKTNAPKDYRFHIKNSSKVFSGFLEEIRQGIGYRQIYWNPKLDLYVTNLSLKNAFENPAATPGFGRSQDIAWIVFVREIKLYPLEKGAIGPTLIPMPQIGVPGLVMRLPEWMENIRMGYTREPGPFGIYQAMIPTTDFRCVIERKNLFHPSDNEKEDYAIYLHEWMKE
jgi:CRISPR-associated protein Cas5t